MIWLTTPAERTHAHTYRMQRATRDMELLLCELAIEAVHPGNLGALPPSPEVLLCKAQQIGLVTPAEQRVLLGFN
ncbi:hypothetical protein [Pseudomonas marincola]|uniref:hypothetical protein n=1 Tax=Pseudomonas marincola TaxID=437900 RepID=UPI0008E42216|nr:hypothetical protein [Pseudomonas marincola]SFT78036.1 hypothetical protein SAMN05216264_10487 [Pseudomonas marincola]